MVTQNTNFFPEQPKNEKDEQQNVAIVESIAVCSAGNRRIF